MSFFAAVQAELADAKRDRANFSCPDTCEHVGCIEGRAACDGRINALERVLTVGLPSYSLPELKAERHTLDIEAGAGHGGYRDLGPAGTHPRHKPRDSAAPAGVGVMAFHLPPPEPRCGECGHGASLHATGDCTATVTNWSRWEPEPEPCRCRSFQPDWRGLYGPAVPRNMSTKGAAA